MPVKKEYKTDVVVVGSGPGGATVARDLCRRGKNVIILERGQDNAPTGSVISAFKYQGGLNFLGTGMIITKDLLQVVRCITTGGTSMMYLGCAWEPPPQMFAKHDIHLSDEIAEIKKELNVQPVPDNLFGPRAALLSESARDLGYKWEKIPKFLKAENCTPNCNVCYYGCPKGAKWHARDWIGDAQKKGAHVMNGVSCQEVLVEDGQAIGVRAVSKRDTEIKIQAELVVVSAGGIGSPAILQRSGIYEAGGSFFFDPFVCAFGYMDEPFTPAKEFPMVSGMHLEEDGIMVTDMPLPFVVFANYALMGFKPHKLGKGRKRVGLLIKIKDDMDGAIGMSEKIVSKPLTRNDHFKLNKGKLISEKILRNIGARDIWFSGEAAAHPGGTCRIGHIVDKNLETKVNNLYVVDASVIPEPWGLPPTLTVVSLARRLSNYLLEKKL